MIAFYRGSLYLERLNVPAREDKNVLQFGTDREAAEHCFLEVQRAWKLGTYCTYPVH